MKVFDIGLNLDASLDELQEFFTENSYLLWSVYFSLPLGQAFYTRKGLIKEYKDSEQKLLRVIEMIKKAGIRTEIVLNTRLDDNQLRTAIDYIVKNNIIPDEIACRNESFPLLYSAFPETKFISCYNNGTDIVLDGFDSIVLGQKYLRNQKSRQNWIDKGYNLILLLNNGCSFLCDPRYCKQEHCEEMYSISRSKMTASQVYALQSFFPEELRALALVDPNFFSYRFKLSTRPLGLNYSRNALKSYASMISSDESFFQNNKSNYLSFGVLYMLAKNVSELNYKEIVEYKKSLSPLKDC